MKSEVRELEQAVCILLTKLDLLFTVEYGLKLFKVNRGVHISTPDHLGGEDAFVTIRPSGWPKESYIYARFYNGGGRGGLGWSFYEGGEIRADHLNIPVNALHFKPDENSILGISLNAFGKAGKAFVISGYTCLIESLQEDLRKLKQ